jgi:hypothetical protein
MRPHFLGDAETTQAFRHSDALLCAPDVLLDLGLHAGTPSRTMLRWIA